MQVLFRFGSANARANERPSGWKKSVDLEYTESVKYLQTEDIIPGEEV